MNALKRLKFKPKPSIVLTGKKTESKGSILESRGENTGAKDSDKHTQSSKTNSDQNVASAADSSNVMKSELSEYLPQGKKVCEEGELTVPCSVSTDYSPNAVQHQSTRLDSIAFCTDGKTESIETNSPKICINNETNDMSQENEKKSQVEFKSKRSINLAMLKRNRPNLTNIIKKKPAEGKCEESTKASEEGSSNETTKEIVSVMFPTVRIENESHMTNIIRIQLNEWPVNGDCQINLKQIKGDDDDDDDVKKEQMEVEGREKSFAEELESVGESDVPAVLNEDGNKSLEIIQKEGGEIVMDLSEEGETTEVVTKPVGITSESVTRAEVKPSPLKALKTPEKKRTEGLTKILSKKPVPKMVEANRRIESVCKDRPKSCTPYARVSHSLKRKYVEKYGTSTPEPSQLRMMDLIFYNPKDNPMTKGPEETIIKSEIRLKEEEEDVDDVRAVPRLKLAPDGSIVVDTDSLPEKKEPEVKVDEEEIKKKANLAASRQGWSFEDTVKFYKALHTLGADFSTMATVFPDRTRKNLKHKFKKEERINGSLVDRVLSHPADFDFAALEKELAEDEERRKQALAEVRPKKRRMSKAVDETRADEETAPEEVVAKENKPTKLPRKKDEIKPRHKRRKPRPTRPTIRNLQEILAEDQAESLDCPEFSSPVKPNQIVINTNILYDCFNITKSVSYTAEDFESPVDINITINHQPEDAQRSEPAKSIE